MGNAHSVCQAMEKRVMLSSQPYTFQNASIGAGGYVDGIFYSPTQANVIYARTDIGGLYKTTNDGTTWQELLDFSPPNEGQMLGVLSFAMDPENANIIYADTGMYSGSNGWLLSSTNGGATFSVTNLPFYVGGNSDARGTGERLAVDPHLGSILFLGTNDHGLYQSNNSGATLNTPNTAFNNLVGASSQVTFVYFDPRNIANGNATQTIYVGVASTAAGTNIYKTTNGGTSWAELAGGPSGLIPMRASLDSDGNLYFTFSNALPPGGNITNGGLWRYNTATSVWANVSPVIPQTVDSSDYFGYNGLAIDPEKTGTLVVTSFDRYNRNDTIWRSTNANTSSPTWVALYDLNDSSGGSGHYGGNNITRNYSQFPWTANIGNGIGNWASAVAINPFNSAQLMYGTGEGIWATNNATSTTQLSAANSWYFPDAGIEFTAVTGLSAPASGVPLYSVLGDIGGFVHTTLTSSPAAGDLSGGTAVSIDFAQSNPGYIAYLGGVTNDGAYSTNSGATWTNFGSTANGNSGGSIAVSANSSASSSTIVWAPGGSAPYYSTNNGTTWIPSTLPATAPANSNLSGGTVISDRVNPNYFYYYTRNSSYNNFILYVSSNGGQTFTLASQTPTGECTLKANPFVAGDLWLTSYNPLYESTNFGASFNYDENGNPVSSSSQIALGAPAPNQSYAALYVWGTINGITGAFRSDDHAKTWVQVNDAAHQWGGNISAIAADPSTYGRFYMGFNGRAIIIGNPANNLPAGWSDADINTPGNPGFATNSSNLSNGTIVNQWTVDGGGAGLAGTSDQFNFASEPVTGNYAAIAQIESLDNTGSGVPLAGVMFRAGNGAGDVSAAIVQTTANQLLFEYRSASGGTLSTVSLSNVPISAEYVELVRVGTNFSAAYGTDGVHWTQLGSTVTLSAMPATANAGLVVSAAYNPQLSVGIFTNVSIAAFTQTLTSISIASPVVARSSTQVSALDQFGNAIAPTSITWSTTGGGTINSSGVFTANQSGGTFTIKGIYSTTSATTTVTVVPTIYANSVGNNDYAIRLSPMNSTLEQIFVNVPETASPTYAIALSQLSKLSFAPTTGDGSLTIDFANGSPLPIGGVSYSGGDTLFIVGNAAGRMSFSIDSTYITYGTATASLINYSGISNIEFDMFGSGNSLVQQSQPLAPVVWNAGIGNNELTVNAGLFTFLTDPSVGSGNLTVNDNSAVQFSAPNFGNEFSSRTLYALNISANATATVQPIVPSPNRIVLQLNSLFVDFGGTLDLGANDLILHTADQAALLALVQSGANGGSWNGTGIDSSAAESDSTHLTAIGTLLNSNNISAIYQTFDGQPVTASDTLLKYTYYGDTDLNGVVDGSDYTRLDSGYLTQATGWSNGDLNYDGVINGSDYTLIDNAFNIQGATLAATIADRDSNQLFASKSRQNELLRAAPAAASASESTPILIKRTIGSFLSNDYLFVREAKPTLQPTTFEHYPDINSWLSHVNTILSRHQDDSVNDVVLDASAPTKSRLSSPAVDLV